MISTKDNLCVQCHKRRKRQYSDLCGHCWYDMHYQNTIEEEADYQDWEWSVCEECGSSLGSDGLCHNTNCGASPDVGMDWE